MIAQQLHSVKDRYVVLRECVVGAGSSSFDAGCRCDHHASLRSCSDASPPESPADPRHSSSSGPSPSSGHGSSIGPEVGVAALPGAVGLEMLRAQLELYESERVYNTRQARAVGKEKKSVGEKEKDAKDKKEHVHDLLELLFVKRSAYVKAKFGVTCYFARETIILGAYSTRLITIYN